MSWIVFFVFLFPGLRFIRSSFIDHEMIGRLYLLSWCFTFGMIINYWLILVFQWMRAKLLRSCLTLCDPMDCSPEGFSVQGILQARKLEWVTMTFSRGSSQPRDRTHVSLPLLLWQGGTLPLTPPGKTNFFVFLVFLLELSLLNHF